MAPINPTPTTEPVDDIASNPDQGMLFGPGNEVVDPSQDLTDNRDPSNGRNEHDQPDLDFFIDDNWEEGVIQYRAEDELALPPPPVPPLPLSTLASPNAENLPPPPSALPIPPTAIGVPAHKHAENTPDPFWNPYESSACLAPNSIEDVHPYPGIYLLYMLVTWLHLQFHLPFRACTAVMHVFVMILHAFGTTVNPAPIASLPRIMKKLDVEPIFDILPVCASCLEVYPSGNATPTICIRCNSYIFKPSTPTTTKPSPLLQFPSKSLESQLVSLLAVPGIEDALDAWRAVPRRRGEYIDVFDGEIPKNIPDPEGRPFFRNGPNEKLKGPNGELRIALTLGVDWFSYLRSQIAPSHSSCPMSFNVANLPPHLRYRTANLLLTGIMPGPKEQNPDECQRFLRIIVNELLRLWKDGVVVPTPSCPEGRLLRLILIAICCDKPAAHKMGGFGSHSHTFFCTKCWVTQSEKGASKAYEKDGFPKRTDKQHREAGERYANLGTNAAREEFVRLNATRWTEFARLPYFDLVRMVVVDPMHNLILGLVKTHFYHIWVQGKILRKTKELKALHTILNNIKLPAYLGRLPSLMGVPAGGSLTADQWLLMATVVGPIAIPQIWDEFMGDPEDARRQREKANREHLQRKSKASSRTAAR